MKILHCCLAVFYADGYSYQENILPKMHKLAKHDVKIVASTETYLNHMDLEYVKPSIYVNDDGIPVTRIPYVKWLPGILGKKIRKYKGFYKILNDYKPDIIFLHDAQFLSVFELKKYLKKNLDVKLYVDCHTDFSNSARNWFSREILHKILYKIFITAIEPYVLKFYGTLPARCDFLRDVYLIPENKIELLSMGADDTIYDLSLKKQISFRFRKKFRIPQDHFLIISGGKINERKKIHYLLKAFSDIPNKKIVLLIFGKIHDEIKEQINVFNSIENIIFTGWLNSLEINELMLSSDLAVFPGKHSMLWEQSIGFGVPCIFKSWYGIDHLDLGGNCLFIENSKISTIKTTLKRVLNDKKLYESMKKNSLVKGPSSFAYSKIAVESISC